MNIRIILNHEQHTYVSFFFCFIYIFPFFLREKLFILFTKHTDLLLNHTCDWSIYL